MMRSINLKGNCSIHLASHSLIHPFTHSSIQPCVCSFVIFQIIHRSSYSSNNSSHCPHQPVNVLPLQYLRIWSCFLLFIQSCVFIVYLIIHRQSYSFTICLYPSSHPFINPLIPSFIDSPICLFTIFQIIHRSSYSSNNSSSHPLINPFIPSFIDIRRFVYSSYFKSSIDQVIHLLIYV